MSGSLSALEQWPHVMMNTYGIPQVELVSGSGAQVTDSSGRTYIDMLAGIAVNSLGHAHPAIVSAVSSQITQLGHVSNLFASEPVVHVGEELIRRFARNDGDLAASTRVFFCNSGAEANETAFKIARLTGRTRILAAVNGFHGRTMGALALTGQPDKQGPFEPMTPGVSYYPFGDIDYLTTLVEMNPQQTAAIFLEPIQGETGVIPAPEGFLRAVRDLCDKHGILMMVDEVQTGIGRTGDFFAFQHEGVVPDVVTMAKGLGGGLPIGACLAHGHAAELMQPGKHGTTFGGNPVSCAAAGAVLHVIDDDFCHGVATQGQRLAELITECVPGVVEVRGRGLMVGVVLEQPIAQEVVKEALNHGLILNAPSPSVLRLTPPLVVTDEDCETAVSRLAETITVLNLAAELKKQPFLMRPLQGPLSVAVLFDKTSTRTRFSFDAGISQLGGNPIVVSAGDSQLGKGETIQDTGAVLSRFVSMIVWRTFAQKNLTDMAETATVPIINALSDAFHPCQLLADLQTCVEHLCPEQGPAGLKGKKAVYLGDGSNNMTNSYMIGFATAGMDVSIITPKEFQPRQDYVERARRRAAETGATVTVTDSLDEVVGADVVITDTWVSMGMEHDGKDRRTPFLPYQVNDDLMAKAKDTAIFLHCLPAYRGQEVTASVIDGRQSVVFDEAENRLHAQKALMAWLLEQNRHYTRQGSDYAG